MGLIILGIVLTAIQVTIFHKLKKIIMASAEETLRTFATRLQAAKDEIIAKINSGGDLTSEEVEEILGGVTGDIENIVPDPPPPTP